MRAKLFIKSQKDLAGIYIHIPFCKQACHYCNFHFSTSLRYKNELLEALLKETALRKHYLQGEPVETIYFGGGTPSLLAADELEKLLEAIRSWHPVADGAEITLEANPDDITGEKLREWKKAGINRLSIGVQSFFDEDLSWMNRAHQARQASDSLRMALQYFENISIDLIYGTPGLTHEYWKKNIETAISLGVPHLSCYALTVEPQTRLHKMISLGQVQDIDPGSQSEQFLILMDRLQAAGYEHYEISNFALPGRRSRHNSSYWQGKKYLGLGPSAHSYDGSSRQWNISNNRKYAASILQGIVPATSETLTPTQQWNETIMIALRTQEGLQLDSLPGPQQAQLIKAGEKYLERGLMKMEENRFVLTNEGKLLADGIAAELFFSEEHKSGGS